MRSKHKIKKDADAWLDWELLRRGVLLGCIPAMKQRDIVEACGFEQSTISKRESSGLAKAKNS